MKNLLVIIKSTNKNSIYQFLFFFLKNTLKKKFQKKIKNKKITILTSPHIFKTAQEQFQKKTFEMSVKIQTKNLFQYLISFKKLNYNALSDCHVFLKYKTNSQTTNTVFGSKFFNPMNFKIYKCYNEKQNKKFQKQKKKLINKINLFLKTIDVFGELFKYKKLKIR